MISNLFKILLVLVLFNYQCNANKTKLEKIVEVNENFKNQSPISECGLEGFTKSETEHIVNEIRLPFKVREIKGVILSAAGAWPKGIYVLFEIRRKDRNSKIKRVLSDGQGVFKIEHVQDGEYCFKATVYGWQSVVGIIVVTREADPQNIIAFQMLLGL